MIEFEKGSMEEALINLQNFGLEVNEHKKKNKTIPVEVYESLLEFTITTLRQVDTYQKEMNKLFDQVKSR